MLHKDRILINRIIRKSLFFVFAFCVVLKPSLFPQQETIKFESVGVEEGLQASIHCITQDSRGLR